MSDDMKQACMPPPEQDQWIRDATLAAALLFHGEDEKVRAVVSVVMRKSGGRCNPAYVAERARAQLRGE